MALEGANSLEKFMNLLKMNHRDQAVFCLNACWNNGGKEKVRFFYDLVQQFPKYDLDNQGPEGCLINEASTFRVYEANKSVHSCVELRQKMRKIGYEPKPVRFPLCAYIILELDLDWEMVVNSSPGSSEELEKAKRMVADAKKSLDHALQAEKDAVAKEAELKAAKAEAAAALADVQAQEAARDKKTQELTQKSEGTGVAAMRAKQELAQHLAEDPLPLRKAKITLEAANRKLDKAVVAAEKARADAEQAAKDAAQALEDAQAYLREVSAKSTSAEGSIAFMEMETEEMMKYLPSSKKKKLLEQQK